MNNKGTNKTRGIDGLTMCQRAFVKEFVENKGNGTAAIKKAYPNVKTANPVTIAVMAKENLKKPLIVKSITQLMDERGMSLKELEVKHKQLLNLKEKKFNKDGEQIDERIDPFAVKSALDMAYKLRGLYKNSEFSNLYQTQVNLYNDEERTTKIRELEAKLLNPDSQAKKAEQVIN